MPSGATLGTTAGAQAILAVLVAYNAGSPVLCVANVAGSVDLSETGAISPTTISSSATSASVIYSASAVVASSPYRVVGFIEVTEATAGTWATAPSLVQGAGGMAFASMQSFGFGQTWQNVMASRALNTVYTNTTGRPIFVTISAQSTNGVGTLQCIVNGVAINGSTAPSVSTTSSAAFVVPPGGTYSAAPFSGNSLTLSLWAELR